MPTDTERLDFLQALNDQKKYTGRVVLRSSRTGRGWRLHETSEDKATCSIRDAIDNYMAAHKSPGPIAGLAKEQERIANLRDGEPCRHPGCLSHISHPCEGCGRIAGRRDAARIDTQL